MDYLINIRANNKKKGRSLHLYDQILANWLFLFLLFFWHWMLKKCDRKLKETSTKVVSSD